MKKNNTTTTATKQRRQQAAKARRARRLAERAEIIDRQVRRRLQVFARLAKANEKQILDLQERIKKVTPDEPLAGIPPKKYDDVAAEIEQERQERLKEKASEQA